MGSPTPTGSDSVEGLVWARTDMDTLSSWEVDGLGKAADWGSAKDHDVSRPDASWTEPIDYVIGCEWLPSLNDGRGSLAYFGGSQRCVSSFRPPASLLRADIFAMQRRRRFDIPRGSSTSNGPRQPALRSYRHRPMRCHRRCLSNCRHRRRGWAAVSVEPFSSVVVVVVVGVGTDGEHGSRRRNGDKGRRLESRGHPEDVEVQAVLTASVYALACLHSTAVSLSLVVEAKSISCSAG